MLFLEFKLNTKEGTVNEKNHLFIFTKFIKKNERKKALKLQMRKKEPSDRRKWIDSYDKKTLMRIQFILEIYVYRQK